MQTLLLWYNGMIKITKKGKWRKMKVTREENGSKCEKSKGVTERQDQGVLGLRRGSSFRDIIFFKYIWNKLLEICFLE